MNRSPNDFAALTITQPMKTTEATKRTQPPATARSLFAENRNGNTKPNIKNAPVKKLKIANTNLIFMFYILYYIIR